MAPQATVGPARVLGHQFVDFEALDPLRDAVGHAQVELADRVGVGQGGGLEGAGPQRDVDRGALLAHRGVEAVARHLVDQARHRIVDLGGGASALTLRLQQILANLDIPPLEPVPSDHVLTKSFYLLDSFPGRYADGPLWVEATPDTDNPAERPARAGDGVSSILITGNDMAAAWATDDQGFPMFSTVPADPWQREYAYRAGVNIVMYMLTGNYKADQVHIPALLERLGQ